MFIHKKWLLKVSVCAPGIVGILFLVLGAVCRALVVGGVMSCVGEEWKETGRKLWMGMRMEEGALGLYGDWTLTWRQCWCLHLESMTKS